MAAKQVIVLDRVHGDGILTHGLIWVVVPTSFQAILANPLATSQFVLATSAELAEIQLGHVAEVPFQVEVAKSLTLNQQKNQFLLTASVTTVQYLSSQAVSLQYYGAYYDGAWSV